MELINKFRELDYRVRTQLLPTDRGSFNCMILMFHRVVEALGEYRHPQLAPLHVSTRRLENLIIGLRDKGYEILSLDGLCEALNSDRKKARFVVFTFDDAYLDTYELAYPVFRKHDAPFTVYVPTAVPDKNFIWWYYMLDDLVYRHQAIYISILNDHHHFDLRTDEQKFYAYKVIEGLFNSIHPDQRKDVMQAVFSGYELDSSEYERKLSMSWDQLAELGRSGLVTIGGHSVSHNNLADMTRDEARNEMLCGKNRIEEKLGITVDHFCYPFGCKSAAHFREFDLVKKLGFKTATTSRNGYITHGHRHYLERLPRIMVDESVDLTQLIR